MTQVKDWPTIDGTLADGKLCCCDVSPEQCQAEGK
jgi:hypothetical protein